MESIISSPYLAQVNISEQIIFEISSLAPALISKIKALESIGGRYCLEAYSHFLTKWQQEYLLSSRVVPVKQSDLANTDFLTIWHEEYTNITDPLIADIGGEIAIAYAPDSLNEDSLDEESKKLVAGRLTDRGKIPIVIIDSCLIPSINEDNSPDPYDINSRNLVDEETLIDDYNISTRSFFNTWSIFLIIIHEKLHGLQDHRLPLVIREASAYYYEREIDKTFKRSRITRNIMSNMDSLADLFAKCVEEIGDDIHLLIFGNLPEPKFSQILNVLKDKFNNDVVDEISGKGVTPYSIGRILWSRIKTSEV